jgi:hypothetical protein
VPTSCRRWARRTARLSWSAARWVALDAILYALTNPTKVSAVLACIPAFDPEYVRNNDPNGSLLNKTAIEANYGVGTVPAGKQAYSRGADFAATGIPLQLWYSTTDTFTPLASTQTFITASGCDAHSLGAVGHTYLGVDTQVAAAFLAAHTA